MATRAQAARSPDLLIGLGVLGVSVAAAVVTRHWTALLAPVIWLAIVRLSDLALPQRFATLVAATALLPSYPLRFGLSVDDIVPSVAAIAGVVLLARWGFPRMPKPVEVAFGVWLAAAVLSALVNGGSASGILKVAGPSVGRPLFWLVFTWSSYAIAGRGGIRALVVPVAIVAIAQSAFASAAYVRCTEIHLGPISSPDNREVWDTRRPLGVEQGAGTNVGDERIRCRSTGMLGQSSNFLAAFLVTTIPAIGAVALASSGKRRTLFAIGAAIGLLALTLTFTRAALIAAAVALFITLLFAAPRKLLPPILIATILLASVAAAVPQIRRRLSDSTNDRRALWYSGWLVFKDHPALGVGFGRYLEVQRSDPKYLETPFGIPATSAHNGFIAIAAEGGVFQVAAVVAIAWMFMLYGWRAVSRARGRPNAVYAAGALGGAAGFLVQNTTNTLLLVPAVATYFWVFGGGLLGYASEEPDPSA